jgi:hypothetical protein
MERAGMPWTLPGAQALSNLRCLALNDEWEAFIKYHIEGELGLWCLELDPGDLIALYNDVGAEWSARWHMSLERVMTRLEIPEKDTILIGHYRQIGDRACIRAQRHRFDQDVPYRNTSGIGHSAGNSLLSDRPFRLRFHI